MSVSKQIHRFIFFCVRKSARCFLYYPKVLAGLARRSLGKTSFIVDQAKGTRSFDNGNYAIFLIWQPKGLPWYVRNALDALAAAKINVVVVANHPLTAEMRAELTQASRHVLIRDNTGLDVGGYQDATAFIKDNFSVDRLLYLNDSIYFFREGLTEFFTRLISSKADLCAPFENWEITYHVQSFCFSMSRHLLDSAAVDGFWKKYVPVNSRLWAIRRGEIGLSRAAVPNARTIDVLYTPKMIQSAMNDMQPHDRVALNKYLPIKIRKQQIKKAASGSMVDQIGNHSQIHTGGFLYRKFGRCPIIKRDLVYRAQYSLYDVEDCLEEVGHEGHLDDILADMRRKGNGLQLPFLKRALFIEGMI